MDGSALAVRAGAAADRYWHRLARSVAAGRAALRARGARHGRDRRLAAAARRRASVRRQASVVLLAARFGSGGDAFAAHRLPAAIVSRCIRLRRAGLRSRSPLVESRSRTRRRIGAAVHGAIRMAGTAGADRCDVVFLDDAQLVRSVASLAARPVVALVRDRLGCGRARRDHQGRRLPAAAHPRTVRAAARSALAAA